MNLKDASPSRTNDGMHFRPFIITSAIKIDHEVLCTAVKAILDEKAN